jgi:sRNA-binding carbon storage regulator CsrA
MLCLSRRCGQTLVVEKPDELPLRLYTGVVANGVVNLTLNGLRIGQTLIIDADGPFPVRVKLDRGESTVQVKYCIDAADRVTVYRSELFKFRREVPAKVPSTTLKGGVE